MVEGGDAVHAARRQFQAAGHVHENIQLQKAEQFLGLVEHLDQRVLLELAAFQGRVQDLEALVAAGVGSLLNCFHSATPSLSAKPIRRAAWVDRNPCARSEEAQEGQGWHAESRLRRGDYTTHPMNRFPRRKATASPLGERSRSECAVPHTAAHQSLTDCLIRSVVSSAFPTKCSENKVSGDAGSAENVLRRGLCLSPSARTFAPERSGHV